MLGAALGGAAVLLGAAPALAKDVGDGGLPEGMLLLQQVLMFQKQWKVLPCHRRPPSPPHSRGSEGPRFLQRRLPLEVPRREIHVDETPPWRQPRRKWMVSLVNSHTNATSIGWHLWEIYLRFATGLPPGRVSHGLAGAASDGHLHGMCNSYRSGRSTTRAEDAHRTPTQSQISPSILVYEDN